jgi:hypothetical protein
MLQQPQDKCEVLLTVLILVTVNPMYVQHRYGFLHLTGWEEAKMSKQIIVETVSFQVFRLCREFIRTTNCLTITG